MKKFLTRWGALILVVLMYLAVVAIPLSTSFQVTEGTFGLFKYTTTSGETTTTYALLTKGEMILEIVLVAILVILAVLAIKFRAKVAGTTKVYESEAKRVSWLPWDQTKKSTWAVLVVMIVCAAAICLLDWGLSSGFIAFIDLF